MGIFNCEEIYIFVKLKKMDNLLPTNIELLIELFPNGSRPIHQNYKCSINEKEDYRTTLRNYDTVDTFFYCDPPNLEKNLVYYPELLTALDNIKGKFILRHAPNKFFDDVPHMYKYESPTEIFITNYKCGGEITAEKRRIAKTVFDITEEQAQRDLENFMTQDKFTKMSRYGLTYLNYFFLPYRLDTKVKNITFYDFYKNPRLRIPWMKDFLKKKSLYEAYKLGIGAVAQFRPTIAYDLYKLLKPTKVLDPSAGWGGRALGAVKFGCEYTGFDTNTDLKEPYTQMLKDLGDKGKNIHIEFIDSAKVDYSKYDYDMIFTSPPYYTLEKYKNMPTYENYDDWLNRFFKPLIENTYKHLRTNGYFCMNVSANIFEDLKKIIGRTPNKKIKLPKSQRALSKFSYDEYIYVWKK